MKLSNLYNDIKSKKEDAEDHLKQYDASYEEIVYDRDNSEEFEAGYITACKQILSSLEETYPVLKE